MSVLEILKFPHPVLRKRAAEIETVDERIRRLADQMVIAMYREQGIGLAAPQVGVSERLIVVDLSAARNPAIFWWSSIPCSYSRKGRSPWKRGAFPSRSFAKKSHARPKWLFTDSTWRAGDRGRGRGTHGRRASTRNRPSGRGVFLDHISRLKRSRYILRRKKDLAAEKASGRIEDLFRPAALVFLGTGEFAVPP